MKLLLMCGALLFGVWPAQAGVIRELRVEKDTAAGTLIVRAYHPPRGDRLDIVRQIQVVVDDAAPIIQTFSVQAGPWQQAVIGVDSLATARQVQITATPRRGPERTLTLAVADIPERVAPKPQSEAGY